MKRVAFIFLMFFSTVAFAQNFGHLNVGEKALDFTIKTIQGEPIQFNEINNKHTVVLVILRGFPGYQCPICTRQVGSLLDVAEEFSRLDVAVIMVYPGPSEEMQEHANEFAEDFEFPDNFYFTLDPDYSVINKYGLRWDAPKETAYPSTFIVDKTGEIKYSKISTKHGGRAKTDDLINELENL